MTIPRYVLDLRSALSGLSGSDREMCRAALQRIAAHLDKEACDNGNVPTQDRYRALAARFLTYALTLSEDGISAVARYQRNA